MYVAGLSMVLASLATPAIASTLPAPEIDTGSLTLGLGLLTGAALILRSRMRRK